MTDPRYVVNPELNKAFNEALDRERIRHERRVEGKHTVRVAEYQDKPEDRG